MDIKELVLYKYKRMSNLPYDKFVFKPKSKVNLILGSNGMGKSSLLKELLPNTEDTKKEYLEDGYKILKFEHNNRLYEISYIRNENKFSFIVDGNELNPSYNMKTFKRLVEEHFNLSKEVFNLLIGVTNFTTMSTGERKKWFTEILSDTDYEYGLVIYNKARIRYRELTGMLKMIESKLLKEYEELKKNNTDLEKIKSELQYLENIKKSITENIEKPASFPNVYQELKTAVIEYEKLPYIKIDNDLDTKLEEKRRNIENIKIKIEELNKQILHYSELLNNNEKVVQLEKELVTINKNIKDKNIDLLGNAKEWLEIYNYLTDNYSEIIDIDSSVKTLNVKYKIDDIEKLSIKLEEHIKHKEELEKKIKMLEYKIEELERVKDDKITCPKCGNIWSPKFNQDLYKKLQQEYDNHLSNLNKLSGIIPDLKTDIEILNKRKDLMWRLSVLIKSNNHLLKYVREKTLGMDKDIKINEIPKILIELYKDLKENIETFKLMLRKNEIEEQLKWIKEGSSINKTKVLNTVNELSDKKIKFIEELEVLNRDFNKLKNNKKLINEKLELRNKILSLLRKMHYYKINKFKEIKYKYDLNVLDILENMISSLKDKLTDDDIRKNKIKELEDDKRDLLEKRKAVNKIIEALSPSKGLLAKGLVEFVNSIVEDMNVVISNIFDYDLSIKPIDLENGKLDFNFRLISKGNEITDISKGSSGMREVIDLAFKLVAMNILGMEDYPLILDEFGRALDPVHRSNAYEYINEISNEMFSRVFIVTHNEDVFSRFPNANVVLLDKEHYNIK